MIKLIVNNWEVPVNFSTFPGGEEYAQIQMRQMPRSPSTVEVHADIRSSKDFMRLCILQEALTEIAAEEWELHLGYLPYARQDRVCAKGEGFSLRFICSLINAMSFDRVYIEDCHSEVGLALLKNVRHKEQKDCINQETHNLIINEVDVIVAPDAGAAKKAQAVADKYGKPVVQCLKTRTKDGISVRVLDSLAGKTALVIDDICDGGGTFLALANALHNKEPDALHLYVTHGIFSAGKEKLLDLYKTVGAFHDWTST